MTLTWLDEKVGVVWKEVLSSSVLGAVIRRAIVQDKSDALFDISTIDTLGVVILKSKVSILPSHSNSF